MSVPGTLPSTQVRATTDFRPISKPPIPLAGPPFRCCTGKKIQPNSLKLPSPSQEKRSKASSIPSNTRGRPSRVPASHSRYPASRILREWLSAILKAKSQCVSSDCVSKRRLTTPDHSAMAVPLGPVVFRVTPAPASTTPLR